MPEHGASFLLSWSRNMNIQVFKGQRGICVCMLNIYIYSIVEGLSISVLTESKTVRMFWDR